VDIIRVEFSLRRVSKVTEHSTLHAFSLLISYDLSTYSVKNEFPQIVID